MYCFRFKYRELNRDYFYFLTIQIWNKILTIESYQGDNNSTVINQQAALGVVCAIGKPLSSVEPAVYIESVDYTTSLNIMKPSYYTDCPLYDLMPVNAVGEGQINVCGEGGNIQAGDLICTSSTSGKGMRQSDDLVHSYTVAKSRETVTFTGTEFKQIACIYLCG